MVLRVMFLVLLMASVSCAEELTLGQAVQRTIVLQADIIYSKLSADSYKSAYEGSAGSFDNLLSSSFEYSTSESPFSTVEKKAYGLDYYKTKTKTYELSLSKLTRSGIELETTATVADSKDINLYKLEDYTSTLGVSVKFPVFDLLMENAYTTSEKIALETSRSALQDYFYQSSTSVYQTVLAYWNYLAAYEKLLVYQTNERNTRNMLSDFEKLIEKGERPRTDANQIRANLTSKQGQVVAGEKNFVTSAFDLAEAMGVPFDESNLPPPQEQWVLAGNEDVMDVNAYIYKAFEERFDLKSLQSSKRAAELYLDSAKRNVKPDFYLYASASYSETAGHIPPDVADYPETYTGGFVFSTYLGNRTAKSNLTQYDIALRQKNLKLANSKRKASMEVASAVNELRKNLKAYEYAVMTVDLYKESLNVEEKKLKLGMSTVIDVISIRESYQNALISKIEYLHQVASSLAGLVYVTGGMITVDDEKISVNLPALFALNAPAGPIDKQETN